MKLTKNINIKVYEVLADYKVKVKQSPFSAILKFAQENGGKINANQLYEDFLHPLSKKACENILDRLSSMGYFEKEEDYIDDDYDDDNDYSDIYQQRNESNANYTLTELGNTSAEQEEFYENRHGIIKIHIANNEFVKQKVVKIEGISRQDPFDEKYLINIDKTDLIELTKSNQRIELENGIFILDNFKEKCRTFNDEKKQLLLQSDNSGTEINLIDYNIFISANRNDIREAILYNEFYTDYNHKQDILLIDFNPNQLKLQRNIKIESPKINETYFNPIKIESVKLSPKNKAEAKKWFKALLIQNINKYFFSDEEFNDFANSIAEQFTLFNEELKNSLSKYDILEEIDEKDFYRKTKLETIDYLNY